MIDIHTLTQYSTLDPGSALVRITQIYKRPSLEVRFGDDRTQEWYKHFLETYHKTGQRYEQISFSPDKLTKTTQIFWIDEEHWENASRRDPFAVENLQKTEAHCSEHGILHTRIREVKKDGLWWASVKTLVGTDWEFMSIGSMMTTQVMLPGTASAPIAISNSTKDIE